MKYCSQCGTELNDNARFCSHCGFQQGQKSKYSEENEPMFPYALVGFFAPIAGLILYLMWNETYKRRAKAAGKWALVSAIIQGILFIILIVLIVVLETVYA